MNRRCSGKVVGEQKIHNSQTDSLLIKIEGLFFFFLMFIQELTYND